MIPEIADTFRRQWFKELYSQFPSETRKVSVPRAPSKLGRKSSMAELMRHLLVTAEFNAPMLSDVQNGLPTQVQYGLGYLLEIGRAYGSDMPTTSALLQTIEARESIGKHVKTKIKIKQSTFPGDLVIANPLGRFARADTKHLQGAHLSRFLGLSGQEYPDLSQAHKVTYQIDRLCTVMYRWWQERCEFQ